MKYLLTKNDVAQAISVDDIQCFKHYLFFTENIKIEKNLETDGWKVIRNKPTIYKGKDVNVLYQYTKEYTKDEVFEDINLKDLCYKLGYELYKQI